MNVRIFALMMVGLLSTGLAAGLAQAACNGTQCATATANAGGGSGSYFYWATGSHSGIPGSLGFLTFTDTLGDTCTVTVSCSTSVWDPLTHPTPSCHIAVATTSFPGTVPPSHTSRAHC